MVVYFSGTGNSRWCAKKIAKELDDEVLDSSGYIRHGIAAELITGKPWVFVAPVYAWQLPQAFEQFIRTGNFDGSKEAYFVLTCGSEIGNAGKKLAALCREVGLTYMGVLPVIMPENYIAMFDVPGAEECVAIISAAETVLEECIETVQQNKPFSTVKVSTVDRLKSGVVNRTFYAMFVKAKQFRTTATCIGCGKCEQLCPLGNIRMENGRPVWGGNCTHCMACICYCPTEAIEYGQRTVGRRRYRCEDYMKE